MKNLSLIFVVTLLLIGCKKGKLISPKQETYCIYKVNSNGSRTYLECASDKQEMQQRCIYYRDININTETKQTNGCDECQ